MAENRIVGWTKDQITAWVLGKLWGVPIVTAVSYSVWAAIRGPVGPEVFLGGLIAAMVALVSVAAFRGFQEIRKGRSEIEDIRILIQAHEEQRAKPELRPTVEMLEEGRREQLALIARWRAMVIDLHAKVQAAKGSRSVRGLIEEHPDYPSLRARMTVPARHMMEGTVQGRAAAAAWESTFDSNSTYAFELRLLMEEIDRLERERSLQRV